VLGHAEADDAALAAVEPAPRLLGQDAAARPAILRRTAGGEIGLAVRLELLRRAEAVVGVPPGQQLVGVRRIKMKPLRLPVRAPGTADVRALVPLQAEPAQIVEDALLRRLRRSLGVGVLDAQDVGPLVAAREQPVEQRHAPGADAKRSCRTRREAYSHDRGYRLLTSATACAATASPRPTASTPSLVLPLTLTRSRSM